MSLQQQIVPIILGKGVNQKKDKKTLSTDFSDLKNAYLNKEDRLDKRFGTRLIARKTDTELSLKNGRALAVYQQELLQQCDNRLYSRSETRDLWLDRGPAYSVAVSSEQIIKKTRTITQCDSAETATTRLFAYEEADTLRWTLLDRVTGAVLVPDTQYDLSGIKNIRCLSFGMFLYMFYVSPAPAGDLIGVKINPTLGTIVSTVTIAADIAAAGVFDVINFQNRRMALLYGRAADMHFVWLNENLAPLSGILAPFSIPEVGSVLSLAESGNATISMGWYNGTAGTRAATINPGGTYLVPPFTVSADTTVAVKNLTLAGWQYPFNGEMHNRIQIFFEKDDPNPNKHFIMSAHWNYAGTLDPPAVFLRGVGLKTKAFIYDGSDAIDETGHGIFVGIVFDSPLQATTFIVNQNGVIISKHQPGTSSGIQADGMLANVWRTNDVFSWAMLNKTKLVSENGNVFSNFGVLRTQIDFKANSIFNALEMGKNLLIVGGILQMYDGYSVVEMGFHVYPEGLTASTAAGAIPAGNYLYTAHYEWTDARGQIHRSATAVPLQVTLASPSQVTVTVPLLRLTEKKPIQGRDRSYVSIVLSRTAEGDSSTFYRITSVVAPVLNAVDSDSIGIVDNLTDAQIFANEILYTSGGVLDNAAPPACKSLCIWNERLAMAGLEMPCSYAYSKLWSEGSPVEFAEGFQSSVPEEGGPLTAIEAVNDKLWIAKEDRYFVDYGDGPNDLGIGTFSGPDFVSSDCGCIDQETVVRSPIGIFFKSHKGFYLLDSNFLGAPVGHPVEDYNPLLTTSAILHADQNQVRFTHADGPTLVYDYHYQQWEVFDYYDAHDAIMWRKTYALLRTDGGVYLEDRTQWRDDGRGIQITFTTGWITFASIAGFQRIFRFQFIGEYLSAHKIQVSVGYDFNEAWRDTYVFDAGATFPESAYGEGFYGEQALYGGKEKAYTIEGHLSLQKCQAIRFRFDELTPSSSPGSGEALTLTALSLLVGIKAGMGKYPLSRKIGAT